MAAAIRRGDRVKLTAHGVRVQAHFMPRAHRVNWCTRRGTVKRVGKLHVYILWDGRSSQDIQPHSLIEPAEED